jgi:hypothetical protein
MAVFNFPYHTFETKYPASGTQIQMGRSYTYTAPPEAPDQRKFRLKFRAMKYFVANGTVDPTTEPEINLAALENFYQLHKMHATFTYIHPVYGQLACRFNKPLSIPSGTIGGDGVVENIEVELVEVPGISDSGISDMILIEYVDFP